MSTTNNATRKRAMPLLLAALSKGRVRLMAFGALLSALAALSGALLLGVSGWFITATAVAGMAAATAIIFNIFTPAAFIRLLALLRTGGRYGERLLTHDVALDALADLRVRLFQSFAARRDDERAARQWRLRPARLLLRLTRDLNAAESLYLRLLVPACAALAVTLLIAYWLLRQGHPVLAAGALLWLLGAGLGVMVWLLRANAQATLSLSRHAEHMRLQALDLTGAQAELSMAGRFDEALAGVHAREAHLAQLESRLQHRDALAGALWQALHALTLGAATLGAAYMVFKGGATAATAAFFILVCMAAMEPFTALRRGASQWAATALAARRLRPALLEVLADADAPALPAPDEGFAVQLQDVHTQRTDRIGGAADGVTLEVARSECVALVGTSGSGKSTLLALIAGLLQPAAGSVRALPSMGLLQQTALFADSVRANLDVRQRGVPDEALWAALRAVALDEVIAERGGLDALLGEGGTGFSRGQQRRLALARLLLATDDDFWLLDEPSDGLDAECAAGVLAHLSEALHARTAVIATHLRREAALADRLVSVESGCITMQAVRGTPAFDALLERLRDD